MKDKNIKSLWFPIGTVVAVLIVFSGIVWKAATWTTLTDSRLVAIEMELKNINDKLGSNSSTVVYEKKSKELQDTGL